MKNPHFPRREPTVIISKSRSGSVLRGRRRLVLIDSYGERIWWALDGETSPEAIAQGLIPEFYESIDLALFAVKAFTATLDRYGFLRVEVAPA